MSIPGTENPNRETTPQEHLKPSLLRVSTLTSPDPIDSNNHLKKSELLPTNAVGSQLSLDEDAKFEETSVKSIATSKDRARVPMFQTFNRRMSPAEITKTLAEQAAIRKSKDYKNGLTTIKEVKLNVEDRYSDEGELDTPTVFEVDAVKSLDKWQLENKKKKIISVVQKKNDSIGKQLSQQPQDSGDIPDLNLEILGLINKEDDFDEKAVYYQNKKIELPRLYQHRKQKTSPEEVESELVSPETNRSDGDHVAIRGIEAQKRDRNREILNELVFKKLKQKYPDDLDGINRADLTAQIKIISDETMNNFLALKGLSSINDVNNLQKVTNRLIKKKHEADKLNAFKEEMKVAKQEQRQKEQSLVDYKLVEQIINKNYSDCEVELVRIQNKISNLNHDSYVLRQMEKNLIKERDNKLAQFDELENKILSEKTDKGAGVSRRPGIYDKGNLEEYMKLQRVRNERKKHEAEYTEKLQEIENNITKNQELIAQHEDEFTNMKNLKAHYKLQLKDLFQRVLREEADILRHENNANYPRVVVSLLRISDDVLDHLLPSFLDKDSANYILETARIQLRMEQYCKENGLTNLLDSVDDTKADLKLPPITSPRLNSLEEAKQMSILSRDLHASLEDIKERLTLIKRMEIKAKRTVVLPSPKKYKERITKEENVDLLTREDHEKLSFRDDRALHSFRYENSIISGGSKLGIDYVTEQIRVLDAMKKNEIARIFKQYISKNIDDRLKNFLMKTFRYLFGKREGEELFMKFVKEKRMYDQKMQKMNKAAAVGGPGGEKKLSPKDEKMTKLMQMKISMSYSVKNGDKTLDRTHDKTHNLSYNMTPHGILNSASMSESTIFEPLRKVPSIKTNRETTADNSNTQHLQNQTTEASNTHFLNQTSEA